MKRIINEYGRDVTSIGSLPFYAILVMFIHISGKERLSIELLISLVIVLAVTYTIRALYFKERPRKVSYSNMIEKLDASSFPSVHCARMAIMGLLFTINLANYYFAVIFIWTIVVIVCATRAVLKKHYFIDIVGGLILGLLSAYVSMMIW
jgi:membrane-associated phospholipid phosphatase